MKKNYLHTGLFSSTMDKTKSFLFSLAVSAFILPGTLFSQQTYTFTNAGATGINGPTQTQITNAYLSTNLQGSVTQSGNGLQTFTIPVTGGYGITAIGASGGTPVVSCVGLGGLGASMYGEYTLTAGKSLRLMVWQMGLPATNSFDGGGGGGSFLGNKSKWG